MVGSLIDYLGDKAGAGWHRTADIHPETDGTATHYRIPAANLPVQRPAQNLDAKLYDIDRASTAPESSGIHDSDAIPNLLRKKPMPANSITRRIAHTHLEFSYLDSPHPALSTLAVRVIVSTGLRGDAQGREDTRKCRSKQSSLPARLRTRAPATANTSAHHPMHTVRRKPVPWGNSTPPPPVQPEWCSQDRHPAPARTLGRGITECHHAHQSRLHSDRKPRAAHSSSPSASFSWR